MDSRQSWALEGKDHGNLVKRWCKGRKWSSTYGGAGTASSIGGPPVALAVTTEDGEGLQHTQRPHSSLRHRGKDAQPLSMVSLP